MFQIKDILNYTPSDKWFDEEAIDKVITISDTFEYSNVPYIKVNNTFKMRDRHITDNI